MARATRLLALMQLLRRHRHPVSGAAIAAELGISPRTLYRDVAALQAQGAHIDGAPGLGYVLRPGYVLPPLMFSADEVQALVLGMRWVVDRADTVLAAAARDALAKIAAVLPSELRLELETSALLVGPAEAAASQDHWEPALRAAVRQERVLHINYRDAQDSVTQRDIWPFALGYFDRVKVVVAWCELRQALRHFRTDRIAQLQTTDRRYPRRRQALLKQWRADETGRDDADRI